MRYLLRYIQESKAEVSKVSWPRRAQSLQYTLIVVGVSAVSVIVFGGLDYVFSTILTNVIL